MGKKPDEGGAPAYMGLFTSLMTVLLAFFILLVAMADTQEAGFYEGVGSVNNSLGIQGGFGVLSFAKYVGDRGVLAVEIDGEFLGPDEQQQMISQDGKGGGGTTDVKTKEQERGFYLSMFVPETFKEKESKIDPDSRLAEYLRRMSVGFLSKKEKIIIRAYSADYENNSLNQELAMKRAFAILKFLRKSGMVDNKVEAVGYAHNRYFDFSKIQDHLRKHKQAIYFYIYRKK